MMNENETKPTPRPAGGDAADHEIAELLREYVKPVLFGAALALIFFVAVAGYRTYRKSQQERATALLNRADTAEKLQQVVWQYPKTSAAPMALLALAADLYHGGNYDGAENAYHQFIQDYPGHILVSGARLGLAFCLEGRGDTEAALAAYQAFVKDNPGHYLEPMAVFGRARCLARLGKPEEARTVYEDYIAAHPDGDWATHAELALRYLDMDRRAHGQTGQTSSPTAPEPIQLSPLIPSRTPKP